MLSTFIYIFILNSFLQIHTNKFNNTIPHKNTLPFINYPILWIDYLQPILATLIFLKTVRQCSFPTYSVFSFYIHNRFYIIYTFYPYYYHQTHSHNTHLYIPYSIQFHLLITNTLLLFKTNTFFDSTSTNTHSMHMTVFYSLYTFQIYNYNFDKCQNEFERSNLSKVDSNSKVVLIYIGTTFCFLKQNNNKAFYFGFLHIFLLIII